MSRIERSKLKEKYKTQWEMVAAVICEEDPIGLLEIGAPEDEYDPEVGTILPRIKEASSVEELCKIVHSEFVHWFGQPTAGPLSAYSGIAKEIWHKYHAKKSI